MSQVRFLQRPIPPPRRARSALRRPPRLATVRRDTALFRERRRRRRTRMKLFLDTANVEEIREAADWGILDGVTTNPTLLAKAGRPLADVIEEICEIVDG